MRSQDMPDPRNRGPTHNLSYHLETTEERIMARRQLVPVRATTADRGSTNDEVELHTVEQLGPKMSRTPNGNLFCQEVPIARVGWMIYAPGETPIKASEVTGYARVYRGEDELFRPETVGSFMGAAVVDEHPEDDVTPKNWKKLSQGFSTTNVRRGSGDDADVLLADLVITDEDLIQSVLAGKREVSCGYDADYEQTGEGEGRQKNIIGNHIALVEKGRCGPRCAIGDHAYQPTKEKTMVKRVSINSPARVALRRIVRDAEALLGDETQQPDGFAGTEGLLDAEPDGDEGKGGVHIHLHQGAGGEAQPLTPPGTPAQDDGLGDDPVEARFQAIEATLQQMAESIAQIAEMVGGGAPAGGDEPPPDDAPPPEGGDEPPAKDEMPEDLEDPSKGKTADSKALATSFAQLLSDAEVLVPGFRAPTFDATAKRAATIDRMCATRRKVVDLAYSTVGGKALLDGLAGIPTGKTLDTAAMTCPAVAQLFRAAVTTQRLVNNRAATSDAGRVPEPKPATTGAMSIAAINKANAEFWAKQSPKA